MEEKMKCCIREFLENKIQDCCVLVIGDVMLDRYFSGDVKRISPEAPVPVNCISEKKDTLGGAGNVAHNVSRLGCQTKLLGLIGNDHHGKLLLEKLKKLHISESGLIFGREKTTTKIRIIGGHQQMMRLDFEETDSIKKDIEEQIKEKVVKNLNDDVDVVIVSDYGKGVCTEFVCQMIIREANARKIPVLVDPKGERWEKYKGADYITPNVKETRDVIGKNFYNNDDDLFWVATKIQKDYSIKNVMITRSEKGISLYKKDDNIHVPTVAQEVFDVSGAGDTVISTFAAAIGVGLEEKTAVELANFAAGIEVGKLGTYAVSREDILVKL